MSNLVWGSVADWISGLGGSAAVVTALYLSRADQRISLRGYCGFRMIAGPGVPPNEYLLISVTNVGRRATTLNNVGMRTGLWMNKNAVITAPKDFISDGIPVEIKDGEVRKWAIPMGEDRKWLHDLAETFVTSKLQARLLRFYVWTTHGTAKRIKPERAVVDAIIAALEDTNRS